MSGFPNTVASKGVSDRLSAHSFVPFMQGISVFALALGSIATIWSAEPAGFHQTAGGRAIATMAAGAVAAFALIRSDKSAPERRAGMRRHSWVIAVAVVGAGVATVAFSMLTPGPMVSPSAMPFPGMLIPGSLNAAAVILAYSARSLVRSEEPVLRVAVVGTSEYSRTFIGRLAENARSPAFVGLYADGAGDACPGSVVLGQVKDLVVRSRFERIDAVVIALPLSDIDRITRLRADLRSIPADIYVASEILDLTCKAGQVDRLGGNPVIKISSRPLTKRQSVQKRALDWALSATLLAALAPLLALIAIAVRLDSPGPALFRQYRHGLNNAMFGVLKFRTMYHHLADMSAKCQTTRGDVRVTRIGRLLRKTSLDELPQLLNVLRGDMSLVGPRPHAPDTKAGDQLFHEVVAGYALRHRVKPGITGWAQINGWRGETRTREQIEQRVAHDLHYIDNWSFLLDIKILILTVVREFNSKAAF